MIVRRMKRVACAAALLALCLTSNVGAADDPLPSWNEGAAKQAIIDFHDRHPLEGYRRLAYMMLDADVVAVSPASVYRVLKAAGRLDRRWASVSKKGTGFVQPENPTHTGTSTSRT